MRVISKVTIGLAAAALLAVSCSAASVSEESLGLRKTDIYTEKENTRGDETKYSTSAVGSGHKIQRAFQDAPPMIPHDVEGMLPITIDNNQCTSCHMPEVAVSMGATPIPTSHFTNFRPKTAIGKDGKLTTNGVALKNTSDVNLKDISIESTGENLANARFNCSACHAPQSEGLAVENNFKADYTSKDGANKSSWSGTKLLEGLNTVEGK